jgi:hypothetical protein
MIQADKTPNVVSKQYRRYQASQKFEGEHRRRALAGYLDHYARIAVSSPELLNQKLPRKVFSAVLDEIGALLQLRAQELSARNPDLREFLCKNALPDCLGNDLTPEIRAFALLLNALKQWTAAEQAALDRFLMAGNVRSDLKELTTTCLVCPEAFTKNSIELHHPVRDGRPPLPISKKGHETIEGIVALDPNDEVGKKLVAHRKQSSRKYSWRSLRLGCLQAIGTVAYDKSISQHRTARSTLSFVQKETCFSIEVILGILERYELGEPETEASLAGE